MKKSGFDSQTQALDYYSNRSIKRREEEADLLYSLSRSVKTRRRREEDEESNYGGRKSSNKKESTSRHAISLDINHGRSSCRRRRRDESSSRHDVSLDINHGRSSYRRRRRDESSRRHDISMNINHGWPSYRRRRRDESSSRHDISLDIKHGRSSYRRRRREESSSRRDVSLDIKYGRSSCRRRRRDESSSKHDASLDINHGRSSYRRRRRDESSSKHDASLDINHGRSSNGNRGRDNISNFHSSHWSSSRRITREDSSRKNNRHHDVSRSYMKVDSGRSGKCGFSYKFYEEDDDINSTPVGSFPGFVDDGVVAEILSRLPIKSILRFKSVCKHWMSLITSDPHFIDLHSTRLKSPLNLLCIAPLEPQDESESETLPQRTMSANLSVKASSREGKVPQVILHNVKKTTNDNWFNYDLVLEPVNGLICFLNRRTASARIYNVGTREVTPWIKSTLLLEEKDKFESEDNPVKIGSNLLPIYQMGFDPEKKEHKVFCFWRLSARGESYSGSYSDFASGYASWEALTVGRDTKWRRINVVPDENNLLKINEVLPPRCPKRSPVHANGSIYWRNKAMSCEEDLDDPESVLWDYAPTDPDVIIAFDVGSEKFRIVPIPSFILDEPREKMLNRPIAMLLLGGRITLIYQMSNHIVKLWMLDDGVEKKMENCRGKGSSNWSAETITLPFYFDTRFYDFHGVATWADKILIPMYGKIGGGHKTMACLFYYDCKTKTCEEIEMDDIFLIPLHHSRSLFATFTESLFPVQPLKDNSRQLELVI